MLFNLNPRSSTPIWEQIVNQVKELIIKGVLLPNDQLLPVRELSTQLLINPNTVSKAYRELERLGVTETFRGKGTFVSSEINLKADQKSIDKVKQALKQLIVESSYLNIEQETFMDWVKDYMEEMGGEKNAGSKEHK